MTCYTGLVGPQRLQSLQRPKQLVIATNCTMNGRLHSNICQPGTSWLHNVAPPRHGASAPMQASSSTHKRLIPTWLYHC